MKLNEFNAVQEGIWDSIKHQFAKSGALGAGAQRLAFGKEVEREKAQAAKGYEKEKLDQFLKDLPVALAKGIRDGLITTTTPTPESAFSSMEYNNFNKLIENILNEAGTISINDFINRYVKNIATKLNIRIGSDVQQAIDNNITDFVSKFMASYNPSLPAERQTLSEPAKNSATSIFNTMIQAGQLSQAPSASTVGGQKYGSPKVATTVEINGVDYEWNMTDWTRKSDGFKITDEDDINQLNKKAYTTRVTPIRPSTFPDENVPDDIASGGTWTPKGAANSYTFDKATSKWFLHRPAPTGGTAPPPTEVTNPRTIETLNRAWEKEGPSLE